MPKFIKKVTAQRCPIHQLVLEECGRQLVEKGFFSKAQVIDKLRLQGIEEAIRWDYISDFLKEPELGHGFEVIPLAQKFFSSSRSDRIRACGEVDSTGRTFNLGQYMAGGHGKKTAGYARASFEGGVLALKRAQNFAGMRNGVGVAFERFREAVLNDKSGLNQDVRDLLAKIPSPETAQQPQEA